MIHSILRKWGGRYHPIVPVRDGVIAEGYLDVIKHHDPDYIFYSDNVDPEMIRKLRFFNPTGYYNLNEQEGRNYNVGVDALYLVSQFELGFCILMPGDVWNVESSLKEFYQMNFGFWTGQIQSDYEITKKFNQIIVNAEDFSKLNQIIYEHKPINQAQLSKRNSSTPILQNSRITNDNTFEIVLTKDKTSIDDILYYWNRELYECHNVLYMTIEELSLLAEDSYFGKVLNDLSNEEIIDIVSFTLSKEEIEAYIQEYFSKITFHRIFRYKDVSSFPFEVGVNQTIRPSEQTALQTLFNEEKHLFIPRPSFIDKVEFYQQQWAVDTFIHQMNKPGYKRRRFPLTTLIREIMKGPKGRINKERNVCFYANNYQYTMVEVTIPEFTNLLNQLTQEPIFQGTHTYTKFVAVCPHDISNKMNSLIRMFHSDFYMIDEFFRDKFWMDIFEDLCTSKKVAGDSISFQDLFKRCLHVYEKEVGPLGKKEEVPENPENLRLGLQEMLKTLCELGVFLQGFKLKCTRCSSSFWYHLKEVGNTINCKGCLEDFSMPIEPNFSYKLNDLVKNNIYHFDGQRDGNLTVIMTLVKLNTDAIWSFDYSYQVNLYDDNRSKKPANEIDIAALVDGKLVIGEAKHNSKEFSANGNKSLNSLIEVAKDIRPDKLILSCYVNDNHKLEKAKKYLEGKFYNDDYAPEIEMLLLPATHYHHLKGSRYFHVFRMNPNRR
ncbi:MAG: hypothetical protein ACN6OB_04505 [Chryseobacterium jejuense]|uniref:hypothetical protein n=1 Tax=Chryseobacterium jejuense TaxID=445960 RepID=UPI003D0CB5FC